VAQSQSEVVVINSSDHGISRISSSSISGCGVWTLSPHLAIIVILLFIVASDSVSSAFALRRSIDVKGRREKRNATDRGDTSPAAAAAGC